MKTVHPGKYESYRSIDPLIADLDNRDPALPAGEWQRLQYVRGSQDLHDRKLLVDCVRRLLVARLRAGGRRAATRAPPAAARPPHRDPRSSAVEPGQHQTRATETTSRARGTRRAPSGRPLRTV
jgi:hypothetical protein